MGLLQRFLDWRSERREDRAAIAEASSELRRVGDEPVASQSETVNAAFEQLPPMP